MEKSKDQVQLGRPPVAYCHISTDQSCRGIVQTNMCCRGLSQPDEIDEALQLLQQSLQLADNHDVPMETSVPFSRKTVS